MPRLPVLCLLSIILCSCSPAPAPSPPAVLTPTVTFTEIPSLKSTPTITPTETLVPTSTEKPPAQDAWQVSPDGHILFNETKMWGDYFTVNRENNGEYTRKYWEGLVRGLWNLNAVSKNQPFLAQFSTDQSLIDYLNNGGGSISDLRIPVKYPNGKTYYRFAAALKQLDQPVDLSQIELIITKPTKEEIYTYSPSYDVDKNYIAFFGASGEVFVEVIEKDNKNKLRFTFKQDLLIDSTGEFRDGTLGTSLALREDKTPEENLLAATQLLRSWLVQMQSNNEGDSGQIYFEGYKPPLLGFEHLGASAKVLENITTLDGSPLALR